VEEEAAVVLGCISDHAASGAEASLSPKVWDDLGPLGQLCVQPLPEKGPEGAIEGQ